MTDWAVALRASAVVHELSHNVVGKPDDGNDHEDSGWLASRFTPNQEYLGSGSVAEWNGVFARPRQYWEDP